MGAPSCHSIWFFTRVLNHLESVYISMLVKKSFVPSRGELGNINLPPLGSLAPAGRWGCGAARRRRRRPGESRGGSGGACGAGPQCRSPTGRGRAAGRRLRAALPLPLPPGRPCLLPASGLVLLVGLPGSAPCPAGMAKLTKNPPDRGHGSG